MAVGVGIHAGRFSMLRWLRALARLRPGGGIGHIIGDVVVPAMSVPVVLLSWCRCRLMVLVLVQATALVLC